ncbi:MAG: hypothetical protein WKG07_29695 [Hymenobacter sp.]
MAVNSTRANNELFYGRLLSIRNPPDGAPPTLIKVNTEVTVADGSNLHRGVAQSARPSTQGPRGHRGVRGPERRLDTALARQAAPGHGKAGATGYDVWRPW